MENMIRKIETMFLIGSELTMDLSRYVMGGDMESTEAFSETAIQLLIETFGRAAQDMKVGIAKTDSVS